MKALFLSFFAQKTGRFFILTEDYPTMLKVKQGLDFFKTQIPVWIYPSYDSLPFDPSRIDPNQVASRLQTLEVILQQEAWIVVAPFNAWMDRILPPSKIKHAKLNLAKHQNYPRKKLAQKLVGLGFYATDQVLEVGEFSFQGDRLDIFPALSSHPYRVEFFDDLVEEIRRFDVESQTSLPLEKKIDSFSIWATSELFEEEENLTLALENLKNRNLPFDQEKKIRQRLEQKEMILGFRPFLPLFYKEFDSLFAYLPPSTQIIFWNQTQQEESLKYSQEEIEREYKIAMEQGWFAPNPKELFLPPQKITSLAKSFPHLFFHTEPKEDLNPDHPIFAYGQITLSHFQKNNQGLDFTNQGTFGIQGIFQQVAELYQKKIPTLFSSANFTGAERIANHLQEKNIPCFILENYDLTAIQNYFFHFHWQSTVPIFVAPLEKGFFVQEKEKMKLSFFTEEEIFGHSFKKRKQKQQRKKEGMHSLAQLQVGDYAVHMDYGIGKYLGLHQFDFQDHKVDCLTLEYAGQAKVYVPIDNMHLVQKYSSLENTTPLLHKIGDIRWQNTKKRVMQSVETIAQDLIHLYAKRKAEKGYSFLGNVALEEELQKSFPYFETEDQEKAIEETLADLEKETPMDRLICGDVGFGKTEIAIRAACRVMASGFQVALIAPTTILAEQHFLTFQKRMANFSFQIGHLSRFLNEKDTKQTLTQLKNGELDLVIGTHRLLSSDVEFHNLGLLVIDEEHRFGVKQKEKIRLHRSQIDTLTMSATPIPRTLHMSISGIRDISLINTPPVNRRAVKSRVVKFSARLIQEAIEREIRRGGQVYFIHNRVETINQIADFLQQLLPKTRIGIAHGQMNKSDLEEVMHDFVKGNLPILLASTIVESGLDIPNANTMIINNAYGLGLAQLYQLRGRVGRGETQAYVYYLIPEDRSISLEAEKRLSALQQFTELGSGFKLASLDMEIRGVGNFVGHEQSGNIALVGFEIYTQLLEEAVSKLKPEKAREKSQAENVVLHFAFDSFLPESYIPSTKTRLQIYQELSSIENEQELWNKKAELEDRFGAMPQASKTIFDGIMLKILAGTLGAKKVSLHPNRLELKMKDHAEFDLPALLAYLQKNLGRLLPPQTLRFEGSFSSPAKALDLLKDVIAQNFFSTKIP